MTGEEKVWVAEGSLGLVRAVRAAYFFARITAFFTGDAVGCQKTVMLFSLLQLGADGPVLQVPDGLRGCAHQRRAVDGGLGAVVVLGRHRRRAE